MLQLYSIFHLNIAYSSIEEEQRPELIRCCYWPLLRLARKYDLPFGIEATGQAGQAQKLGKRGRFAKVSVCN
ncbi:MAG: hypothetical protein V3T59_08400 [Desulfobacterales bacterium]